MKRFSFKNFIFLILILFMFCSPVLLAKEYVLDSRNPHCLVKLMDDFENQGLTTLLWGVGGVYNYAKKGDYKTPYIIQTYDLERGAVGKFIFPKAGLQMVSGILDNG